MVVEQLGPPYVFGQNGFVQTRATQQLKHAEFRQAWINALREEMARFLLLAVQTSTGAKKKSEAIHSMAMILMRMNRTDKHYDELVENMVGSRGATLGSATIGTNAGGVLCRISRRQVNTCWEQTCQRRATSAMTAPGASVSATIRALASSDHRRRRPGPVLSLIHI